MKSKKMKLLILSLFVMICCTACNGTYTRNIRHDGFTVNGSEFKCSTFFPANKDDVSYKTITHFAGAHIIDNEGRIWEISMDKTFSNGQNCKAIENNLVALAIMDGKYIKAADGNIYSLVTQQNVGAYGLITTDDNNLSLYQVLLSPADVIKVLTVDQNYGLYYILKNDGNIYGVAASRPNRDANFEITNTSIVYNKNDFGGDIIDFNYSGEGSGATFVRTDTKLYRMTATNESECSKFADVQCNYVMQELPNYATYKDKIIAFNGSTLITDYKMVFSGGSTSAVQ